MEFTKEELQLVVTDAMAHILRKDMVVDYSTQSFEVTPENDGKITIDLTDCHEYFIHNNGTGRVRIFEDYYLAAGAVFSDKNESYKKFARKINVLLSDPENPDPVVPFSFKILLIKKYLTNESR